MKTLLLQNIVSSNTVYRLNKYTKLHKKNLGSILVLFCAKTEANRLWSLREKIKFSYRILPSVSLKIIGRDLFTYFINPSILKELNRYNPDRIIICGWDQSAYQLAFLWGFYHRKQVTLWSGSTRGESSWRRTLSLPLVKFFVRYASNYITYGSRASHYLISLGAKPDKIEVFLNDVNQSYFSKKAKIYRSRRKALLKKYGIKTPRNIIYVGQLIERKGVDLLLRSYLKFKGTHHNFGLIIVGYGQQKEELLRYAEMNRLVNVYFFEFVDQYDLPPFYACADILVLPSKEEVWGLVVNEALHSGLKVVVSDACGCAPDLIKPGFNGFVFKSGSILALLNKLKKAANLVN